MGADLHTGAGVTQSEAPKCPKCDGPMKFVKAKEGKYDAFWSCAKYASGDCDGTRKYKPEIKPEREADVDDPRAHPTEPPEGDPGPQQEFPTDDDKGVTRDDIPF
jgi:ssDNA-binding Zn-finger/Zn-ribbon topoisomerase 1